MLTADPTAKVMATRDVFRRWRHGLLDFSFDTAMPDIPARPPLPELRHPGAMPKRGRGSDHGRIALLHALAHIEFVAIDLALDAAGRFGAEMGRDFVDDWLSVAADEAMHFALVARRLRTLGSFYGAMPAHDGLWEAAQETAHDVAARLAIVPMVLEARALDVTPAMVARFAGGGDERSARILQRILDDEIRHVRFGTKHFVAVCQSAENRRQPLGKGLSRSTFAGPLSHRSTTRRVVKPVCRANSWQGLPVSNTFLYPQITRWRGVPTILENSQGGGF